jgi:transposase-like protein
MPYDEWYDDETREAATARVLERRATKPGDRNVITVVADEFGIPQQTLRAWVEEAAPEPEKPARKPRPKFSQVVTTRIEPAPAPDVETQAEPDVEPEPDIDAEPDRQVEIESESGSGSEAETETETQAQAQAQVQPSAPAVPAEANVRPHPAPPARTSGTAAPRTDEIAALEAEVAALRAGNRVLTDAMRVLLDP